VLGGSCFFWLFLKKSGFEGLHWVFFSSLALLGMTGNWTKLLLNQIFVFLNSFSIFFRASSTSNGIEKLHFGQLVDDCFSNCESFELNLFEQFGQVILMARLNIEFVIALACFIVVVFVFISMYFLHCFP